MADLENLNKNSRDLAVENLTGEQAKNGIKFSPELAGGNEALRNLVSDEDMSKVKELITDADFNVLDKKDVLMREYGFTEEEVLESERYLEEARANPEMIENETVPFPIIPLIIILVAGGGAGGFWIDQRAREDERRKIEEQKKREEERRRRKEEEERIRKLEEENRRLQEENKKLQEENK